MQASTFALKFQEKVCASLFGLGQELSDPCVSSKPISLQRLHGNRSCSQSRVKEGESSALVARQKNPVAAEIFDCNRIQHRSR